MVGLAGSASAEPSARCHRQWDIVEGEPETLQRGSRVVERRVVAAEAHHRWPTIGRIRRTENSCSAKPVGQATEDRRSRTPPVAITGRRSGTAWAAVFGARSRRSDGARHKYSVRMVVFGNRGTGCDVQSNVGRVALSLIAAGVVSACGGSTPSPEAAGTLVSAPLATDVTSAAQLPSTPLSSTVTAHSASTTDEAGIVAAAAVARLNQDNGFGGAAVFDRINIVERYGAPTSDGMLNVGSNSPPIGAGVRTAVEHALAPMVVIWVDNLNDVIGTGQEIPSYEEVGAVLTLSRPIINGSRAVITTALWCGGLCGIGGAHTLERANSDGWRVTGTQGPQWMS